MDDKIKILFLAADPSDQARIRLPGEYQTIKDELERGPYSHRFLLEEQFSVKIEDLTRMVKRFRPHIIQFSGHGSQDGELCFEDPMAKAKRFKLKNLKGIFARLAGQVDCLVLNACYSARQAATISRHIPYVIGFKEVITEQAAHYFSLGFYQALSAGETIEGSFEDARALLEAHEFLGVKPVLKVGPGAAEPLAGPWGGRDHPRETALNPPDRGPPPTPTFPPDTVRKVVALAIMVGVIAIVVSISRVGLGREETQMMGRSPMETPASTVKSGLAPGPTGNEWIPHAGASIEIRQATLLPDGKLEIRGEVHPKEPNDRETIQELLRSFQVKATLGEGAEGLAMIDTNLGTWKVCLKPGSPPRSGKRLDVEAVLFGEGGTHELHRIRTPILVE